MAMPEDIQKLLVRNTGRIKIYLHGLGMTVQIMISGIGSGTASVTNASSHYSIKTPEPGVRPPESAQSEGSRLYFLRDRGIDRRDFVSGINSHQSPP
jgi:hypothetical protein